MSARPRLVAALAPLALLALGCSSAPPNDAYTRLLGTPHEVLETSFGSSEAWALPPLSPGPSRGLVICVPGFPGSALDFATMAEALRGQGYEVLILEPPGHGSLGLDVSRFDGELPSYGRWLVESLADAPRRERTFVVAHSAGAEVVFRAWFDGEGWQRPLPDGVALLNPWAPSVANVAIPWGSDEDDAADRGLGTLRFFGPMFDGDTWDKLFVDADGPTATAFREAHDRRFRGTWRYTTPFAWTLKRTAQVQRAAIARGPAVEALPRDLDALAALLRDAGTRLLVLESGAGEDETLGYEYQRAFDERLRAAFADLDPRVERVHVAGHMIQVERPEAVTEALLAFFESIDG